MIDNIFYSNLVLLIGIWTALGIIGTVSSKDKPLSYDTTSFIKDGYLCAFGVHLVITFISIVVFIIYKIWN